MASHNSRPASRLACRAPAVLVCVLVCLALAPAAAFASGGEISGAIGSGFNGPIQGATVELYKEVSPGVYQNTGVSRATESGGKYSFAVPEGVYKISARGGIYLTRFYVGNAQLSGLNLEGAEPITVTTTNVTGVDITLPVGGQITGKLIDAVTGAPVAGATIQALIPGTSTIVAQQLYSEADGSFTLRPLEGGSYTLLVNPGNTVKYETYSLGPVAVGLGGTLERNVSMHPYATVDGEATDALTGNGIPGITVTLYDAAGGVAWTTVTTAGGQYHKTFYETGIGYRIGFSDGTGKYATQYYKGKAALACADPLVIPEYAFTNEINAAMSLSSAGLASCAGGAPPEGHVALSSGPTLKVLGGRSFVVLHCSGAASCQLEVALTSSRFGHAATAAGARPVLGARSKTTIAAGQTARVRLTLTRQGRHLLAVHHGRIGVRVTVTGSAGVSRLHAVKTLTLVQTKRR